MPPRKKPSLKEEADRKTANRDSTAHVSSPAETAEISYK